MSKAFWMGAATGALESNRKRREKLNDRYQQLAENQRLIEVEHAKSEYERHNTAAQTERAEIQQLLKSAHATKDEQGNIKYTKLYWQDRARQEYLDSPTGKQGKMTYEDYAKKQWGNVDRHIEHVSANRPDRYIPQYKTPEEYRSKHEALLQTIRKRAEKAHGHMKFTGIDRLIMGGVDSTLDAVGEGVSKVTGGRVDFSGPLDEQKTTDKGYASSSPMDVMHAYDQFDRGPQVTADYKLADEQEQTVNPDTDVKPLAAVPVGDIIKSTVLTGERYYAKGHPLEGQPVPNAVKVEVEDADGNVKTIFGSANKDGSVVPTDMTTATTEAGAAGATGRARQMAKHRENIGNIHLALNSLRDVDSNFQETDSGAIGFIDGVFKWADKWTNFRLDELDKVGRRAEALEAISDMGRESGMSDEEVTSMIEDLKANPQVLKTTATKMSERARLEAKQKLASVLQLQEGNSAEALLYNERVERIMRRAAKNAAFGDFMYAFAKVRKDGQRLNADDLKRLESSFPIDGTIHEFKAAKAHYQTSLERELATESLSALSNSGALEQGHYLGNSFNFKTHEGQSETGLVFPAKDSKEKGVGFYLVESYGNPMFIPLDSPMALRIMESMEP